MRAISHRHIYDNKRIKWMIWYNGRVKNKEFIGLATYHKYDICKIYISIFLIYIYNKNLIRVIRKLMIQIEILHLFFQDIKSNFF